MPCTVFLKGSEANRHCHLHAFAEVKRRYARCNRAAQSLDWGQGLLKYSCEANFLKVAFYRNDSRTKSRTTSISKADRGAVKGFAIYAMAAAQQQYKQIAGLPNSFSNSTLDTFAIGIVGDLHLEPAQMPLFSLAAKQVSDALVREAGEQGSRLIQLGDLGGYNHGPGSRECFSVAAKYLQTFQMPFALVTGNHDLEGDEFQTDEENLAAWSEAFGQRHYWAAQLGQVLCLGLSTVKFRSNRDSVHEVFVDDKQLAWFEQQLIASEDQPVLVFTHAPPLGCGLKVVEGVHVKNRCAWLNHSQNPEVFLSLLKRFSNIRLWFSGHYHLSQNYPDSITTVGKCAFVQTGVIGECDRDGYHQSRILRGDRHGYRLYTLNHATGEERLDVQQPWNAQSSPKVEWLSSHGHTAWWPETLTFHQRQAYQPESSGRVESRNGNGNGSALQTDPSSPASSRRQEEEWFGAGHDTVLRRMGRLLVEYKASFRAAVGVVFTDLDESDQIILLDAAGERVASQASPVVLPTEDGSRAVAVELTNRSTGRRRAERNADGGFFQVLQKNKWRLKQEQGGHPATVLK